MSAAWPRERRTDKGSAQERYHSCGHQGYRSKPRGPQSKCRGDGDARASWHSGLESQAAARGVKKGSAMVLGQKRTAEPAAWSSGGLPPAN